MGKGEWFILRVALLDDFVLFLEESESKVELFVGAVTESEVVNVADEILHELGV